MANRFEYGGYMDLGEGKENQEDFINCMELGSEAIFCIIADGTGSVKGYPQPAPLVVTEMTEDITDLFYENRELFLQNPEYFLKKSILHANRVLGGFKIGNDELFAGYSASVSCFFLMRANNRNRFYMAHAGNTRIQLLRNGRLMSLTYDHTVGAEMLMEGKIDEELYHALPERLKLTSGAGILWEPEVQTRSGSISRTDLIVMTTDGIHYALRPEGIAALILRSEDCTSASRNLIEGAKEFRYPDNMSAIVIRDTGA